MVASQRNAQVADVVLRRIDNTITTTNGGMPLELSMAGRHGTARWWQAPRRPPPPIGRLAWGTRMQRSAVVR